MGESSYFRFEKNIEFSYEIREGRVFACQGRFSYNIIGYACQSFLGIFFEIPVMLQVFVPEFFNPILLKDENFTFGSCM